MRAFSRKNNRRLERNHQIEMLRFLGRDFVVQNKRKVNGVMLYDIIAAIGSDISGLRFAAVPFDILSNNKETSDDTTFQQIANRFGL
jgi:hypothetical protein